MEAKDTVMGKELQNRLYFDVTGGSPGIICDWERSIMEVSFKAGIKFAIDETTLETMETGKELGRNEERERIIDWLEKYECWNKSAHLLKADIEQALKGEM